MKHPYQRSRNSHKKSRQALDSMLPVWDFYEHWTLEELISGIEAENVPAEVRDYRDVLALCATLINASPTGRMMLREAAMQGWRVGLSDLSDKDFHLDVPQKILLLDNCALEPQALIRAPYFRHAILISLIRALRDIWQEKRHGGFDDDYNPEATLMLERVRAADCDVMAILVSWELRAEGKAEIWRHVIGSEEGDMAIAFSSTLEKFPGDTQHHRALCAAFRAWHRDENRVDACDHETLEYMDSILKKFGGNPFGAKHLCSRAIEILSCLPDKTAYLQGQGDDIIRDPAYFGFSDPVNQTHLFHIMHDMETVRAGDVAFRDAGLARLIFPEQKAENDRVS